MLFLFLAVDSPVTKPEPSIQPRFPPHYSHEIQLQVLGILQAAYLHPTGTATSWPLGSATTLWHWSPNSPQPPISCTLSLQTASLVTFPSANIPGFFLSLNGVLDSYYMIKSKLLSTIPQRSALTTSVNSSYIPQAPRASLSQVLYLLNGPALLIWRLGERMSPFMLSPLPPLCSTHLNLHPFIS